MAHRASLVVLLCVLGAGVVAAQPMSGTYYIKDGVSSEDTFPSFGMAGNAVQERGLGGNVTFLAFAGVYDESGCRLHDVAGDSIYATTFDRMPGQGEVVVSAPSYCFYIDSTDNVKVKNLTLRAPSYGVRSRYSSGSKVEGCRILGPEYGCRTPICVDFGSCDTITGNYCHGDGVGYGMYIYGVSSTPSQGFVIANNMLDNSYYGMYIYSTQGCRLLYNSMQPGASDGSYGLYLYNNYATEIRDNIIGAKAYAIYNYRGDYTENYNDMWVYGGGPAVIYDYRYGAMDLATWKSVSGLDSGSISADPQFVSTTDCHLLPTSPCINAGDSVAGFLYDIDGDSRRIGRPDMGADEWTPVAIDAGVVRFEPDVSIRPNPLTDGFAVLHHSLDRAGVAELGVYNMAGQAVLSRALSVGRGACCVVLDLRHLSDGVYLVKFTSAGFASSQKLVVRR